MSDMSNFPQHGDMCIGRSKDHICSGHFIGVIKYMDPVQGEKEYAVLQPNPASHQISLVYARTLEPYSGPVTYRNRESEPAQRVLPKIDYSKST